MESIVFMRKFIDLFSFDTPLNPLPLIFFVLINIFVATNMVFAVLLEPENEEKKLLAVLDICIMSLFFSNMIGRSLYDKKELLELVKSDDFFPSHYQLRGRDELWLKIHKYSRKKRINMRAMSRNVAAILFVCILLLINRNVLNYFSGLANFHSEVNECVNWPTPFPIYCPPELKSTIFFIYNYLLQSYVYAVYTSEAFFIMGLISVSTERVLADFDILIFLLDDLTHAFPDYGHNNMSQAIQQEKNSNNFRIKQTENLRRDMALIVHHHQALNRNFKICADGSRSMVSIMTLIILLNCVTLAYITLTTDDVKKRVDFTISFIMVSLTVFYAYHNGQRIFNQNDILRRSLADLPWTDKPQWFKQTLHMMMTRANVDTEMRPYGIYTLNYLSFKDLMKMGFSVGNVFYTKKVTSQTQQ